MLTYADVFRTYASSALTEITSLDSLSLNELRAFVKDMRCSTRVVMKLVLTCVLYCFTTEDLDSVLVKPALLHARRHDAGTHLRALLLY